MTQTADTKKKGKIIVVSAPSGSGKSTIIKSILSEPKDLPPMRFSVSATNRQPRVGETDGIHYRFLTTEQFHRAIEDNLFVEWEEVYPGRYYGTLKSEIDRAIDNGDNVILDIDVKGGINVKKIYGDNAVTIFFLPPSVAELRRRLEARGTDSPETIAQRVGKAEYELSFADKFDHRIVNDNLDDAIDKTRQTIGNFINR